jgi:hypothetical protein
MATFVQLDENNIVLNTIVVADSDTRNEQGIEDEAVGIAFCKNLFGQDTIWKRCSRHTYGGVYHTPNVNDADGVPIPDPDQSKAFRKNGAGIGMSYDPVRDAFIHIKPFPSWTLNEDTCLWDPPTPYPENSTEPYRWDEDTLQWVVKFPK